MQSLIVLYMLNYKKGERFHQIKEKTADKKYEGIINQWKST